MRIAAWICFVWFVTALVLAPIVGKWLKEHVR